MNVKQKQNQNLKSQVFGSCESGVGKVSDHRTIGSRKCFESPENILSLKNEKKGTNWKKEKGEMEGKKEKSKKQNEGQVGNTKCKNAQMRHKLYGLLLTIYF